MHLLLVGPFPGIDETMTMEIKLFNDDIETLRPIAESWQKIVVANEFGILTDVNKHLLELSNMVLGADSDLIVLYDGDAPVGYIGLQYFDSPLGNQRMANEHYLYVIPEKRGISSMRLIKNAKFIAKLKGCSHLILNASNLASDLHDKVCRVYEKMGMKKFETSYISEV